MRQMAEIVFVEPRPPCQTAKRWRSQMNGSCFGCRDRSHSRSASKSRSSASTLASTATDDPPRARLAVQVVLLLRLAALHLDVRTALRLELCAGLVERRGEGIRLVGDAHRRRLEMRV